MRIILSTRCLSLTLAVIFGQEPVHCPDTAERYSKMFRFCELQSEISGSCGGYVFRPLASPPKGWPIIGWKASWTVGTVRYQGQCARDLADGALEVNTRFRALRWRGLSDQDIEETRA